MSNKRWSISRVWGSTRQNSSTSGSGSATAPPSNHRSRADQPANSSQPNRTGNRPASRAHDSSTSRPRRAQRASREEEEVQWSTPIVPDSLWFASDFMLGAGMVIIQPSTSKIVVLFEKVESEDGRELYYWFLPKGRKDVGESLEQTALREAYEESGLRVSFLPIILPHNAPGAPGSLAYLDRASLLPCTEPIYISTHAYEQSRRTKIKTEYLTFWYVGTIPENAVVESGTRMADEVNYETHFLTIEHALSVLPGSQGRVVNMAYRLWRDTVNLQLQRPYKEYIAQIHAVADAGSAADLNASVGAGAIPSQDRPTSATRAAQDAESWEDSDI